nr:DegT/DnrJ/EryC1/StrS family aminotransferase [uncultured Roseateles sp.]
MPAISHPIPTVRDLFWPRPVASTRALMATPGLELTYQARGALLRACREIAETTSHRDILLPAFHCPSGISPALMAGLNPVFYRIRRDLSIDYEDLLGKASGNTCAVLVIHFFGIAADLKPLAGLRERGVSLIEDWSHSFVQGESPVLAGSADSDYRIYSFWKLVPSGVGGGLMRGEARRAASLKPLSLAPLRKRIVNLKQLLEEALEHGPRGLARSVFGAVEALRLALKPKPAKLPAIKPASTQIPGEARYPVDPLLADSAMPPLARNLIEAYDLAAVAQRRRSNFRRYAQSLPCRGPLRLLYADLPDNTCPWVFPVLLDGRDSIDHRWRDQGVALHTFGIYLHSILFEHADQQAIDDALYLADHLLCLAVHQDISDTDIERSADIIRSSLAELI